MEKLVLQCFKSNGRNGTFNLQSEEMIKETDYFAVSVHSIARLSTADWVILITDFPFQLEETYLNGMYHYTLSDYSLKRYFREEGFDLEAYSKEIDSIKMYKLFLNYPMGVSEIQLFNNVEETIIHEFKINVVSDKLNEGEFISLIDYIESKSVALWAKYSLLKNETLHNDGIDKNDWQLLFLKTFIEGLTDKLHHFQFDRLSFYKKEAKIEEYVSDVLIDEDSIYWLSQNLDILSNTNSSDYEKILIQNRLFRPNEILTHTVSESTDVIENQFIHGFIEEICTFINTTKDESYNSYSDGSTSFQEALYFYSQKRKFKLLNEYLEKLTIIKSYLLDFIPVTEIVLDYIPTHRIFSKEHYLYVYEKFVEWFSYNQLKYSNNKLYFKGVTRMDKLFERACLYKLIDVFTNQGYLNEIVEMNSGVPQIVRFKHPNNGRTHTVFFEKYPETYETQNHGWVLKPDFFIEFDDSKVLILDAKYKRHSTVQKFDWEKLSLKYLHGIGHKKGGYFSPTALFALIPASNNRTEFYQNKKYDLNSQTPAFPAIGSLIVDFEGKIFDLDKYIKRIIELI